MRIIFFSDIHGNQYSMKTFLRQIENYDKIIFCGDVFGYYYGQKNILDQMQSLENLTCILGNHDQFFLNLIQDSREESYFVNQYGHSYFNLQQKIPEQQIKFVQSWNNYYCFSSGCKHIAVFHGSPADYQNGRIYPDTKLTQLEYDLFQVYDYVILGHTHHKMHRFIGHTHILNPGSLGQPRDGLGCSYLTLDTTTGNYEWKTIDYDVNALVNDINTHDLNKPKFKEVLFRNVNI